MSVKFRFKSGKTAIYTDVKAENVSELKRAFNMVARLSIENPNDHLTCIDMAEVVEMNVYEW